MEKRRKSSKELEIDKKEFERIQQELIQATVENITLEYFEYEGKKWLNEDFVISTSVIQKKIDEIQNYIDNSKYNDDWNVRRVYARKVLQEILEEGRK